MYAPYILRFPKEPVLFLHQTVMDLHVHQLCLQWRAVLRPSIQSLLLTGELRCHLWLCPALKANITTSILFDGASHILYLGILFALSLYGPLSDATLLMRMSWRSKTLSMQ